MSYVIGVDCGGTKTEAEAYSLTGELLANTQTSFGNLVVDYEQAIANIKKAIEGIFLELPKADCLEITLGIAGIDSGGLKEKVLADLTVYHEQVNLMNDGQLAHYSILKGQDGLTVTAGTGSVVLGLQNEEWFRVGGWGHLLGDEGGAYYIAKGAIQQALKEYDGNLKPSQLTKVIFKFFKVETVFELTKTVYSFSKGEIAAAAVIVAELTEEDNARKLLIEAGADLAISILQIINKMPTLPTPIKIGLNGSVVQRNELVLKALKERLDETHLIYELQPKTESCAKGAYYLNQRNGDK